MGLFDLFRQNRKSSANQAKERLQILIAHERGNRTNGDGPDYLPQMRKDLMDVIRKYVPISDDQVKVQVEKEDGYDILELNITLPDN